MTLLTNRIPELNDIWAKSSILRPPSSIYRQMHSELSFMANRDYQRVQQLWSLQRFTPTKPLPIIGLHNGPLNKYYHQVAAIVENFEVSLVSVQCVLFCFAPAKRDGLLRSRQDRAGVVREYHIRLFVSVRSRGRGLGLK